MSHGDIRYSVSFDDPCLEWDTYGDGGYDLCCHPEGTNMKGWFEIDGIEYSSSNIVGKYSAIPKENAQMESITPISYAKKGSLSCPNITSSTFDEVHPCKDKCSSAYSLKKVYSDSQLSSVSSEYKSCETDDSTEDEDETTSQESKIFAWLDKVDTLKGSQFDCPLISTMSNKNAHNIELKFPRTTVRLRIEVDPNDNGDVKGFVLKESDTTCKASINGDVLSCDDVELSPLPPELENIEELNSLLLSPDYSSTNYNIAFTDTCDVSSTEEKEERTSQLIPWLQIYKSSEKNESNIYTKPHENFEIDITSSGETMLSEVISSENDSLKIEYPRNDLRFKNKGRENPQNRFITEEQEHTKDFALLAYDKINAVEEGSALSSESEDSLQSDELESGKSEESDTDIHQEIFSSTSLSSQEFTLGIDKSVPFDGKETEDLTTRNTVNEFETLSASSLSSEEFVLDMNPNSPVSVMEQAYYIANEGQNEQPPLVPHIERDLILNHLQSNEEEVYIIRRENDPAFDVIQQEIGISESESNNERDRGCEIFVSECLEEEASDDDLVPERFFSSGSSLRSRTESLQNNRSSPCALSSQNHNLDDDSHVKTLSFTPVSGNFETNFDENTEVIVNQVRDIESSWKPEIVIKGQAEIGENVEKCFQDFFEEDNVEKKFITPASVSDKKERKMKIRFQKGLNAELQIAGEHCDIVSYKETGQVPFCNTTQYEKLLQEKDDYLRVAEILVANVIANSQTSVLLEYWRSHNASFREEKTQGNGDIEDFLSIPDSDTTEASWREIDINLTWSQSTQKSYGKSEVSATSSEAFHSVQSSYQDEDELFPQSSSLPNLAESSSSFFEVCQSSGSNVSKNLKMKYTGKGRGKPYDSAYRDFGNAKRSKEATTTIPVKNKYHANTRNIILQELEQLANMLSKYAVIGAKRDISHEYLEAEYTRQREIRLLARYATCRLRPLYDEKSYQYWPTQRIKEPMSSKGVMKHVNFAADIQIINPSTESGQNFEHICQACSMTKCSRKKKITMLGSKQTKGKLEFEFPQQLIKCSLCSHDHH